MKRLVMSLFFLIAIVIAVPAGYGQTTTTVDDPVRIKTRDQLKALLEKAGPGINVAFRQSDKQPFNMVGTLKTGLNNADYYEIVVGVSTEQTIGFRIYPHYQAGYINLDKVRNSAALMRQLMVLNDKNFMYWGADSTGDIFSAYTFTLESGFPEAAINIVLRSIPLLDKYVGQMRPNIDGSPDPGK
jgi:hypothetical protein